MFSFSLSFSSHTPAERGVKVSFERKQELSYQAPIDENTVWYHEGPNELLVARYFITEYSMPRYFVLYKYYQIFFNPIRARDRLEEARKEAQRPGPEKAARKQELHKKLRVRDHIVLV